MRTSSNRSVAPVAPPNHGPVAILLFVSGSVALVYEVVWQRQFALVFGSAAPATAAVLGAYFAGLGLGAVLVGRRLEGWSRPLRAYAILEASVGLGALLVPLFLEWFDAAYPWLYQTFSGQPAIFTAARTLAAFGALLIPTFCMGGTLPLLGQFVDQGRRRLGQTAGWLYVVNTAGASLGALAFPLFLLPGLGLTRTIWLCAAINGALALAAWRLDRRVAPDLSGPPATSTTKRERRRWENSAAATPVLLPAFISGLVTFALQVLWNRAFAQVHENSMYSFAVIVAVVIAALAVGAQLARVGLRRGFESRRLVAGAWVLAGLVVMSGPSVFLAVTNRLAYLSGVHGWAAHSLQLAGLAAAVILLPMTLLGVGLPAILDVAGQNPDEPAGRALGRTLAVNVAGSVAGALAAGFILPRWLGLWNGMIWLGAMLVAAGWWQWPAWANATGRRKAGLFLAAGCLAGLWPVSQLALPRVSVATAQGEQLLALAESTHGITSVVERPGSRRLKLNNHYGLGGTASTGDERMQAHLPLLLHPAPHRVAFLGLGTGITAGGALFHPVDRVTVVELVPEVTAAARKYFGAANAHVLDDPRTCVVNDDARNYLRGSGGKFDVIVADLVVPWRQGEGSLFTREQFIVARGALAPGGLYCQWLPLFQLSETELNILVRTFLTVFPRAQAWRGDFSPTEPALALIGSVGDFRADPETLRKRLAEMRADPANPQLRSAEAFWMNFAGVLELSDLPLGETRLNSEDRPWIELLGPKLHAGDDRTGLFTGRRLQAWEEQVRLRSRDRLALLTERERSAMMAGGVLTEMTLCLVEGNRAGALAAHELLQHMLPAETFRLLFP